MRAHRVRSVRNRQKLMRLSFHSRCVLWLETGHLYWRALVEVIVTKTFSADGARTRVRRARTRALHAVRRRLWLGT